MPLKSAFEMYCQKIRKEIKKLIKGFKEKEKGKLIKGFKEKEENFN